jgi:hypothetical protein
MIDNLLFITIKYFYKHADKNNFLIKYCKFNYTTQTAGKKDVLYTAFALISD